ncbi:hypothetical protein NC653_038225 [Populus alba x Populus x berolinensis]|uniref:Uncharacterized protein n=2 Tax=Populus TaxID=3689 RepID=A0A4U5QNQ1_POPAL|nr:hypothetical protein NC653_038225 [Populus alba x Populus x berolinensis]TKS12452.1 hypothetical protein D5086_0000063810 [Populus alba]
MRRCRKCETRDGCHKKSTCPESDGADEEFLSVNLAHCKCRSSSSVESFGAASSFHAQNPLPFEVVHGCFTLNTLDPFTMLIDVKIIVPIGFVSTMELSPCQ